MYGPFLVAGSQALWRALSCCADRLLKDSRLRWCGLTWICGRPATMRSFKSLRKTDEFGARLILAATWAVHFLGILEVLPQLPGTYRDTASAQDGSYCCRRVV